VSLLLLVPDVLRGQANLGRASRSASFLTQRAATPPAGCPTLTQRSPLVRFPASLLVTYLRNTNAHNSPTNRPQLAPLLRAVGQAAHHRRSVGPQMLERQFARRICRHPSGDGLNRLRLRSHREAPMARDRTSIICRRSGLERRWRCPVQHQQRDRQEANGEPQENDQGGEDSPPSPRVAERPGDDGVDRRRYADKAYRGNDPDNDEVERVHHSVSSVPLRRFCGQAKETPTAELSCYFAPRS
jgi:hypothetical protein